jgi:hypothetical protein
LVLKILWSVCLLAATGVCSFLIYKSIASYLDYDVVTTLNVIADTPSLFPVITICNTNFVSNHKSLNYSKKVLVGNNFSTLLKSYESYRYYVPMTANHPNYTDEFRKELGQSWEEMLLGCIYNNEDCRDDWVWHFDPYYG